VLRYYNDKKSFESKSAPKGWVSTEGMQLLETTAATAASKEDGCTFVLVPFVFTAHEMRYVPHTHTHTHTHKLTHTHTHTRTPYILMYRYTPTDGA
jgi:hypothetical protein